MAGLVAAVKEDARIVAQRSASYLDVANVDRLSGTSSTSTEVLEVIASLQAAASPVFQGKLGSVCNLLGVSHALQEHENEMAEVS